MMTKSITALNLASKCFARKYEMLQIPAKKNVYMAISSKRYTSYSKPKQSFYDMYNKPHKADTTGEYDIQNNSNVNNNGRGRVFLGEMTYVNNAADSDSYSIPDAPFTPTVVSDDVVSGSGHRTLN